jgi:hypothetical protein
MKLSKGVFLELGLEIMQQSCRAETWRRYRSKFGVSPLMCLAVWRKIVKARGQKGMRGTQPKHLLWALMWLKTYQTENCMSGPAKADEKTLRKWCWFFINAIADLEADVVSTSERCLFYDFLHN